MSWMARLYETYEQGMAKFKDTPQAMMPISHTPQNAHIEITLDEQGNFIDAKPLSKIQIVLQATEQSASRANALAPHPLADKIQYVAADYADYGGIKKAGFTHYRQLLSAWCESEFANPSAKIVLNYVSKGTVVADLIKKGVLHVENGTLLTQWQSEDEPPALFKILPKDKGVLDQGAALVCWKVDIAGKKHSETWSDPELQQQWIAFDSSNGDEQGLCLVKGEQAVLASNHPAKIRHSGDKAKLISANDSSGFTFRGRFTHKDQANAVSLEVTQKAHNALRWLVGNKNTSFRTGDQVYVFWALKGEAIPKPLAYSWDFDDDDEEQVVTDYSTDLGQTYAHKIRHRMGGYFTQGSLKVNDPICMMGLDSATPGRMSVTYYRETLAEEFVNTLARWQIDMAWPQRYKTKVNDKEKWVWGIRAPAPDKIWNAVYGDILKSSETLKKNLVERLLPCIIEGKPIPLDIVKYSFKRAVNRASYKQDETWLWEQNLGIACALHKGYCLRTPIEKHKQEYKVALEEDRTTRDYLYGRLLATAENIERFALNQAGENRNTTADRLMQRFAARPYSTWRNIELALQPYLQRLNNERTRGFFITLNKQLDEIQNLFSTETFIDDSPLKGEFLLGYHSQRLELLKSKTNTEEHKEG